MEWLKAVAGLAVLGLGIFGIKKMHDFAEHEAQRQHEQQKQKEFERKQFVETCDALVTKRVDDLRTSMMALHDDPHGKKSILLEEIESLLYVLKDKPYNSDFVSTLLYRSTLFDQLITEERLAHILELHRKILNHHHAHDEKEKLLETYRLEERKDLQQRINELVDRKLAEEDAIARMSLDHEIGVLRKQLQHL